MRRSLGMNNFCQKNNISASKMWFVEYKCTNCSTNYKYKCTLHPNIIADPRLTYSSCNSRFFITLILLMSALCSILFGTSQMAPFRAPFPLYFIMITFPLIKSTKQQRRAVEKHYAFCLD